ncbi:MAG: hypothetical protein [Caudoviricetes sp.]|nr:MAG: hypothetical protein [Caudoviricetes sp.]
MVQTYKPVINDKPYKPYAYCEESEDGIYVRLADYQKLEAELEQLRQQVGAPADDGWIEWAGGECPVAPWEYVSVKHRSDKCVSQNAMASYFDWSNYPSKFDTDIIAYRVVKA